MFGPAAAYPSTLQDKFLNKLAARRVWQKLHAGRREVGVFNRTTIERINYDRPIDRAEAICAQPEGDSCRLKQVVLIVLIAFTVIVWASSFPAIKVALQEYSPTQLACFRYMVASVVLLAIGLGKIKRLPTWQDTLRFAFCGAVGIALYNVAIAYGEVGVPAGVTSLLVSTSPLFAGLFAHVWLKDRLGKRGWIGLLVSLSGAAIISTSGGTNLQLDLRALAIFCAAVIQGLSIVVQKPLFNRHSSFEVTAYTIWGASLCMAVFLPSVFDAAAHATASATVCVLYLGIVPAALGILAWCYILSRVPASRAASFLYAVPVASLLVSFFWLEEVPASASILGGALSLAGIAFGAKSRSR